MPRPLRRATAASAAARRGGRQPPGDLLARGTADGIEIRSRPTARRVSRSRPVAEEAWSRRPKCPSHRVERGGDTVRDRAPSSRSAGPSRPERAEVRRRASRLSDGPPEPRDRALSGDQDPAHAECDHGDAAHAVMAPTAPKPGAPRAVGRAPASSGSRRASERAAERARPSRTRVERGRDPVADSRRARARATARGRDPRRDHGPRLPGLDLLAHREVLAQERRERCGGHDPARGRRPGAREHKRVARPGRPSDPRARRRVRSSAPTRSPMTR